MVSGEGTCVGCNNCAVGGVGLVVGTSEDEEECANKLDHGRGEPVWHCCLLTRLRPICGPASAGYALHALLMVAV